MTVDFDSQLFQLVLKLDDGRDIHVVGDHDASYGEATVCENPDQAQYIHVVGDSQVVADLIFRNILRADGDHDLCLIR